MRSLIFGAKKLEQNFQQVLWFDGWGLPVVGWGVCLWSFTTIRCQVVVVNTIMCWQRGLGSVVASTDYSGSSDYVRIRGYIAVSIPEPKQNSDKLIMRMPWKKTSSRTTFLP